MGYLADVMRVRSYSRAFEAVERERTSGSGDDGPRFPAPAWAWLAVDEIEKRLLELADADEDDGTST